MFACSRLRGFPVYTGPAGRLSTIRVAARRAFRHQRCLHVGLMRVQGQAPEGLVFELGLRPGASPLVRYRSSDIEVRGNEASPLACPRRAA